jgi:hypothetical protein
VDRKGHSVRRCSKLVSLAGAVLLLATALMFFGEQRAISQDEAVVSTPDSLTVSEPSGSATFQVTLASEPANAVSIPLRASGDCTVGPSSLSLNPSNWDEPKTATVWAADDAIADGPQVCLVTLGPTSSDDPLYAGLYATVTVTVQDDEEGVLVVPTSLSVSEPHGSDTFLLTLSNQPTDTVSISLSASPADECTVSPAEATVDATNWITGVTVTVTAVDDVDLDGPQACTIQIGPTTSEDPDYDGLDLEYLPVTVQDDDQPTIVVWPTSLTVWEPAGSDTFLLTLTTAPTATVSITMAATIGECAVSPAEALLDGTNWTTGVTVTVTAVDDHVVDGPEACIVETGQAVSEDKGFDGLYPENVTVTVEDDDWAGVAVAPAFLTVSEPHGLETYAITLTSQPVADVTILLSAGNDQCRVTPLSIILTPDTWASGQTVEVTAEDDSVDDGDMICPITTGPTSSSDGNYAGLYADIVSVTVQDDDEAALVVEPLILRVTEAGVLDSFNVGLATQPESPVLIPLAAAGGECYPLVSSIVLSETNWLDGLGVTVAAVDDLVADGDTTCLVEVGPPSSDDDNYNLPEVVTVTVTVEDNDAAAVTISTTSLEVSEPSTSDSFAVRLTSQPLAEVTIHLLAVGECAVAPESLSLNADTWATWQTATVTAVNDDIADGDKTCMVYTTVTSDDDDYDGFDLSDVTVDVADDDDINVAVDPKSLEVSEPSGSGTFTLTLASQPLAPVDIPLSPSNGECTVWPMTATLDISNWSSGMTATVTAVDDHIVDGDLTCMVQTGETESEDGTYAGHNPADVTVTVHDNDEAHVLVAPTSLTVREASGSGTFSVSLTSEPAYSVYIPLDASGGECYVSGSPVWLTKDNWSTGVEITVTAFDDAVVDGSTSCLVEIGPPLSDDELYSSLEIEYLTVTVEDNDVAAVAIDPPSLSVSEPSGSAPFVVKLTSQPLAPVTISLTPSNGQCSVLPGSIVLGALNWDTGETAIVSAVDDAVADGIQTCTVYTDVSSEDDLYDGFLLADVIVSVWDDEVPRWFGHLPLIVRTWPLPMPGVPALHPISNSDGLGTYAVAWDAAAWADLYVLEEAKTSTFAATWQVYAGPATSYLVSGRGAARYYYRVKARNKWGDSGWSNIEQVDVLWEAEPNDDALTQANGPVVSGLTYYGTFLNAADEKDYFYFDLLVPHSVELTLSNIALGQDYNLVLRNASLVDVGYSGELGNAAEYILTGRLPAGRYYIQVYHVSGAGSDQPYHLWLDYE